MFLKTLQVLQTLSRVEGLGFLRPGVGPFFLFLGLGFPYNLLKTKKGTLFIPRLISGLGFGYSLLKL